MDTDMIAYCGINCSACEAYLATRSGDPAELGRVAEAWRKFDPNVTATTLMCDGCLTNDGDLFSWCAECPIRICARERAVASCAYCDDYGCDRLAPHFEQNPQMRESLDALRREFMSAV